MYVRKSDATMMENGLKVDATLERKPIKIMKNEVPETMRQKGAHARTSLEVRRVWGAPHSLNLNIYNSCLLRL